MDAEYLNPVDPNHSSQTNSEAPAESPEDREDLDLANQLQRIHDHRVYAYQNQNTLCAVLGGMLCDLAEPGALLSRQMRDALKEDSWSADDADLKAFNVLIGLSKQSTQIALLQSRLTSAKSSSNPENSG